MSMLLGLIAFIDAQGGWWDGAEITNSQLLGLEVRWWARIGKVLQLLGARIKIKYFYGGFAGSRSAWFVNYSCVTLGVRRVLCPLFVVHVR